MSDLKFSCTSCGQHIQCAAEHAGENIPCPSCAQLVRVPAASAVVEVAPAPPANENPFADESKVSYTPTASPEEAASKKVPTLDEDIAAKSNPFTNPDALPKTEREEQIAAARAAHPVQPATTVKPRLSFILSGGQAPVPEDNDSALTAEQKEKLKPSSDIKTVKE